MTQRLSFEGDKDLTGVNLVKCCGIAKIPPLAYANTGIEDINLPNGLKEIGVKAFTDCYFLERMVIPDSVVSIGEQAFAYCQNLKKAVLPKGEFVHQKAFEQDVVVEYN